MKKIVVLMAAQIILSSGCGDETSKLEECGPLKDKALEVNGDASWFNYNQGGATKDELIMRRDRIKNACDFLEPKVKTMCQDGKEAKKFFFDISTCRSNVAEFDKVIAKK